MMRTSPPAHAGKTVPMNIRYFTVLGALLGALGVLLGAYHAHGLEAWLQNSGATAAEVAHRLDNAAIAVRYQMFHALALIACAGLATPRQARLMAAACWLLAAGLLLFSGGLYLIVFAGTALHWAIVPSGDAADRRLAAGRRRLLVQAERHNGRTLRGVGAFVAWFGCTLQKHPMGTQSPVQAAPPLVTTRRVVPLRVSRKSRVESHRIAPAAATRHVT